MGVEKVEANYNEDSIQVLEGLEAVRKRPGMYIGSTDSKGLHHLVYEIFDNSIDEVLAGHGEQIDVVIEEDNSILIRDYGRGMPTGKHAKGASTPEVIFTVLHAGGKFGQGGYKSSGGLHGVGASVVNALSEWLEVTIYRDGDVYEAKFHNGGKVKQKLKKVRKMTKEEGTGTEVRFKPDPEMFSTTKYSFDILEERLRESSFLLKELKVSLEDKREGKEQKEFYSHEEGLKDFVEYLNAEKVNLHKVEMFTDEKDGIEVDIAFQYTDSYSEAILSFVNNVRTRDGGTHETGAKGAITRVINDYARSKELLKKRDKNLEGTDAREGLTMIVSVRVPEDKLQFEGQTKGKLGTPEARPTVDGIMAEHFGHFLNANAKESESIISKAIKSAKAREEAKKAREAARNGKKGKNKKSTLSGKLAPATSTKMEDKELYLVEGDSAGGSAKQGRDRKFQAILPLRGKVINTEKAKLADVLKNEEINTIINCLGAGIGSDFDISEREYDKVIIMTDADTDGAHIQVLLLTFFYRYMKPLIDEGKVFIALPPLYKISKGKGKSYKEEYVWDDEGLDEVTKKFKSGYEIQRYKGLGEMNPEQLYETTMEVGKRTLIQVSLDDAVAAEKRVGVLMGSKAEPRRNWINKNVEFGMGDDENILDK